MGLEFESLWKHQQEGVRRAKLLNNFALLYEAGSGKTATLIHILRDKMNAEKKILRTIIFGPPIILKNWKDEWLMHSKMSSEKVVILYGDKKKRLKTFLENAYDKDGIRVGCIFITNYESLSMEELYDEFQNWHPECLVADESHKIKDYSAKRTKLACNLACEQYKGKQLVRPEPRYKYILTGTPILNSPMDIFTQYWFLDGGKTFGRNFFAFRGTYFRDRNAGMPKERYFPDWIPIPERLAQMNEKIYLQAMQALKKRLPRSSALGSDHH